MTLRRFVIERDIPKVGGFEREQLRGAAAKSNEALAQLAPDIQWVESYVADDKTFCVYLAKDEDVIRRHAEISGFPATKITEIRKVIDPTTGTTAAVDIRVPMAYVDAARTMLAKKTYPDGEKTFYTYTFYDPMHPTAADIDPRTVKP